MWECLCPYYGPETPGDHGETKRRGYHKVRTQVESTTACAGDVLSRGSGAVRGAPRRRDCGPMSVHGQGSAKGLPPSARGLPKPVKTCHHLPRPVTCERGFCNCEPDLETPVADMGRDDIPAWIRVRAGEAHRVRCVEHDRPAGKSGPSPRGACHRLPHP